MWHYSFDTVIILQAQTCVSRDTITPLLTPPSPLFVEWLETLVRANINKKPGDIHE